MYTKSSHPKMKLTSAKLNKLYKTKLLILDRMANATIYPQKESRLSQALSSYIRIVYPWLTLSAESDMIEEHLSLLSEVLDSADCCKLIESGVSFRSRIVFFEPLVDKILLTIVE